jgi:peptidoglycan-associated lipoprotein
MKKMMSDTMSIFALALILLISGCSSSGDTRDDAANDEIGSDWASDSASDGGVIGDARALPDGAPGSGADADPDDRTVYFELDKSDVLPQYNQVLSDHAQFLAENPAARVRLEGHADERGSREYNIGLGERRAQAVRRVLLIQGAAANQIVTVSYGEERPQDFGSSESAWAKNRRVELVYNK